MLCYFVIPYQHSPICPDKRFVCCVKVAEGEDAEAKARAVLAKHRGKVWQHEAREITRDEARRLCPSLFAKKV